ncbi:helix-turn-helix domain-containing protein [Brucella pituitosa]|uniref:helix-turn-helix domain-containing protein n=1 Tax=Brucella pituitosa TaxID=571256 RepID=UPI0009A24246|nr:helix-turn-helix domain-containing protein [Brucella pituitosa]
MKDLHSFKRGDKVRLVNANVSLNRQASPFVRGDYDGIPKGAEGEVLHASPNNDLLTVHFTQGGTTVLLHWRLEAVKAEKPAPVVPTLPMTKAVLDLLKQKGTLTSLEAQGVLRCRSLSKRISELKQLGWPIFREMKWDTTGQRYARYSLAL